MTLPSVVPSAPRSLWRASSAPQPPPILHRQGNNLPLPRPTRPPTRLRQRQHPPYLLSHQSPRHGDLAPGLRRSSHLPVNLRRTLPASLHPPARAQEVMRPAVVSRAAAAVAVGAAAVPAVAAAPMRRRAGRGPRPPERVRPRGRALPPHQAPTRPARRRAHRPPKPAVRRPAPVGAPAMRASRPAQARGPHRGRRSLT